MIKMKKYFLIFLVFFILFPFILFFQKLTAASPLTINAIEKFKLFETEFNTNSTYNNPYTDVSLSAHIIGPDSISFNIDGYWEGGNTWKLRIMPTVVGHWIYTTSSNDPDLDKISGSFECIASSRQGILIINPDYPYTFKLSEGKPFLWLGETSWCLMSSAASFIDGTFQEYITKRVEQKFNGIHFVLGTGGLPRGTLNPKNEGGNLWISQQSQRINPEFFKWMDKRFSYLDSLQVVVSFFITWSQHFTTFTRNEFERFERYLIARYAAYPLLYWVIVGEFDEAGTIADYNYHGNFIKNQDPYRHLISNHPNHHDLKNLGTSRIFAGQKWFDFILQQLPQYPVKTSPAKVNEYILTDRIYNIPVLNSEFGYENYDYYGYIMPSNYVRKYAWSIVLGGGFFSYGHEKTIREVDPTDLETEGATYLRYLYDYFKDLKWWEMNPHNGKVNNGFCLARPSSEYIIYLPDGGKTSVDLATDPVLLMANWFDPMTGTYGDTLVLQGGSTETFTSPYQDDAVLHLFPNIKPIIKVEPDSLIFYAMERKANPSDQTITISNIGGGILNWSATVQSEVSWLSLTPTNGCCSEKINVSIDISNQIAGTYHDTIHVSDVNALNNPINLPVTLNVEPFSGITITTPNGGEAWEVNSIQQINWQSENISGTVELEYSIDNGSTWAIIDSSAQDSSHYCWTIPNYPSRTCLVKITDADGTPFDESDSVFIIAEPLNADFVGEPKAGNRPLTVHFADQSTGMIDSWYWEFGDGTTATDQNPTYQYCMAGSYAVSLTVKGATGQDTETRLDYIQVLDRRFSISGNILYYNQNLPVPRAILNLTHIDGTCADTSNSNGCYYFEAIPLGNIRLAPFKQTEPGDCITGSDVLLVLQYLAQIHELTEDQKFAADVSKDGKVTNSDAQAILKYLAFDDENKMSTNLWRFKPDTLVLDIQSDTTTDFKSYLLGDVNGNWEPVEEINQNFTNLPDSTTILKISQINARDQLDISVPISVERNQDTLHTLIVTIEYDPQLLSYNSIQKTDLTDKFMIAANGNEPGKVHIALAGANGLKAKGEVVKVSWELINQNHQNEIAELKIKRALINDRRIIKSIDGGIYSGDIEAANIPKRFIVFQNQPNPFNQSTKICFDLPGKAKVKLEIFNVLGQKVITLLNGTLPAASHQIIWNGVDELGKPLNSGIYFYQVKVEENDFESGNSHSVMKKMFLLK